MRSAKRWARTAHLHEIKVFHERRGSGAGKWSGVYKNREHDHEGSLGDVFNISPSSFPSQAKSRPRDVFRRPLALFGVVRRSEESTDADAWIDTDVDDDDDASVAGEAVMLNSPERAVFGQLRS